MSTLVEFTTAAHFLLAEHYGTTLSDAGLEPCDLNAPYLGGWTPHDFVAWFARKHDLTRTENPWKPGPALPDLTPIHSDSQTQRHARIRIFIRDGIVTGAETFDGEHVSIDVVDYDTEGHDPEDLSLDAWGQEMLTYAT